ncbi:MAG: restriction endonuclease [Burkholderiaceae bacterium]|nr:restriction endonuclease [Burkholderiaceae bacterium]
MVRRRSGGAFDDLVDLVAMLPWWAGVGLAVLAYVWLGSFAVTPAASSPGVRPGEHAVAVLQGTAASIGRYLVPFICLLGAGLSAWRRAKRRSLVHDATRNDAAGAVARMSWREFEMLVGEAFRLDGYRVVETGGAGADGGVDLELHKGDETFLVQCKQWRAYKVGVEVVRELYGAMAARGAAGGFVVTSGRFTGEARAFAAGRNVELVDGGRLVRMIDRVQATKASSDARGAGVVPNAATASGSALRCPSCGSEMVRRSARRGANAGKAFWGCSRYPACKGTRSVE